MAPRDSSVVGYLASGALAAGANYGSRFLFSRWLPYEAAVVAAYLVGMATAFALMRRFAFRPKENSTASQLLGFCLVNLAAAAQTVIISSVLLRLVLPPQVMGLPAEAVAHAIGVLAPVFSSYFGHRWLSFR